MPEQNTEKKGTSEQKEKSRDSGTLEKVLSRIDEAENVLVALSDNPTVDEMAAAIGLTMALDSIGKHATAIYSGKTPNVLEFLKPQETFETNTNSLQDFIIALNKEKADHLRYKVDGDFVKVYITPYRTTISEDDLEFSRGDFNVDLVIALNVAAATDLDGALKEHGRIMHDASAINITTGAPGKFGEIEWSEPEASSISEMVTDLSMKLTKDLDKGTATALLTGLVAATDRFSNEQTTPEVMVQASQLMKAGADQQLIAANVSGKLSFNETATANSSEPSKEAEDASTLKIERDEKAEKTEISSADETSATLPEETEVEKSAEIKPITDGAGAAVTPENGPEPTIPVAENFTGVVTEPAESPNVVAGVEINTADGVPGAGSLADQMVRELTGEGDNGAGQRDYGKMIDEALAEPLPGETVSQPVGQSVNASAAPVATGVENPAAGMAPVVGNEPVVNNIPAMDFGAGGTTAEGGESYLVNQPEKVLDPANAQARPDVSEELIKSLNEPMMGAMPAGQPVAPEEVGGSMTENNAPEMATDSTPAMEPVPVPSDLPMPGQEILPPPPTPPVDFSMDAVQPDAVPVPQMPEVQVEVPEVGAPAEQPAPAPNPEPGAFQIPNNM